VGLLLVFGSVLLGSRVLASADDTVPVLAAGSPLVAGQRVDEDSLTTVRIRFATEADADLYLAADADLPDDAMLLRAVPAGELLPRSAVSGGGAAELVELPLAVDPARVPTGVRTGSVVDVWVAPLAVTGDPDGPVRVKAEKLLEEVPVLAAPGIASTGAGGLRQVVVGVPAGETDVASVVASLGDGTGVVLVRHPG
jgi:hypothetical protein